MFWFLFCLLAAYRNGDGYLEVFRKLFAHTHTLCLSRLQLLLLRGFLFGPFTLACTQPGTSLREGTFGGFEFGGKTGNLERARERERERERKREIVN